MNIYRSSMSNHQHQQSYAIGDIALSCDIDTTQETDAGAKRAASSLRVGDPAFIRRSDRIWRYAVVSKVSTSPPSLLFVVTPEGSTKKVMPIHWGDRVRPFKPKGRPPTLRRNRFDPPTSRRSRFDDEYKNLRSSCDTLSAPSPFDSQITVDTDRSANPQAGGGRDPPASEEKSSDGHSTDHEQHQQQEPSTARRMKRRGSIRNIMKKLSSNSTGNGSRRDSLECLAGVDISERTPEDMKTHEFNESTPTPIEIEVPQKQVDYATVKSKSKGGRRKPNSRKARANLAITTSGLFKNLMKTAIVDDGAKASKPARRATTNDIVNEDVTEDPGNEAGDDHRTRRATLTDSPAPANTRRVPSSQRRNQGKSDGNPTASVLMKGAFSHLMEEKGWSRSSQLKEQQEENLD